MVNDSRENTDDYELMPRSELEHLRKDVSSIKKSSLVEGDKASALLDSIDRLNASVTKLILIF